MIKPIHFLVAVLLLCTSVGLVHGEDLLVSGRGHHAIHRYDGQTGEFEGVFASGGGLVSPSGLTYGPDGHLYVAGSTTGNIYRFHGFTGEPLGASGTPGDALFGSGQGLLSDPSRLRFGPDGDLYVCSTNNDSVVRFDGATGSNQGVFVSGPQVDHANDVLFRDGYMYVSNGNAGEVARYNASTGAHLGVFAEDPSVLYGYAGMDFGPGGDLYAAVYGHNTVARFDGSTGASKGVFVSGHGITQPVALEFGPDNHLYMTTRYPDKILRFDGSSGSDLPAPGRSNADFVVHDTGHHYDIAFMPTAPPESRILENVPEYEWRRGCSPTSAAMLMGYWDQNGYPNLWTGTPPSSNDPANDNDPVNVVIEQIGDLMGTSMSPPGSPDYGATDPGDIPRGMRGFAEDQDPTYEFKAGNKYASDRFWHGGSWFEGFSFEYLKHEIDADQPMHVGLKGNQLDPNQHNRWSHSVAAYGYQDNPGTDNDWVAVCDTWPDGDSDGDDGIIAKVEEGIEYWKWVTDTSQDYYIYRGGWLHPDPVANSVWGILESRFANQEVFEEQFSVTAGTGGSATLAALAAEPEETAVRLHADGSTGVDDVVLSSGFFGEDRLELSFEYAFETPGTLQIWIDDQMLDELTDLAGLGLVDDSGDFSPFSEEFLLADYGLLADEYHTLTLKLLAGSEHTAFLDDLQLVNLDATRVPGPATLSLLALGGIALIGRRRQ